MWMHECSRVFEDRLINDADHQWFVDQQRSLTQQHFGLDYDEVTRGKRLIYADFLVPGKRRRVILGGVSFRL